MIIDESKFSTKKELFSYLVANKSEIISLKKAELKKCDAVQYDKQSANEIFKNISYANEDDIQKGTIKRLIVGNTYNWMDSHSDVHMDGVFTKSLNENKSKILHLHDHEYKLVSKVGKPIDIFEAKVSLKDLGINKAEETTSLLMHSEILRDYNEKIFIMYLNKEINQHSVGMIYVNLMLAINDPDYKEEYANWTNYIGKVINYERAFEKGYFWPVLEAKLIEISAVIAGSNELTPTIEPESKSTQSSEPVNQPLIEEIKGEIDYKYLIENFKIR